MKVGDLVCYNSAGMKYQTVGMVLEISGNPGPLHSVLIWWTSVGKLMPRRSWCDPSLHDKLKLYGAPVYPGEKVWHDFGVRFGDPAKSSLNTQ